MITAEILVIHDLCALRTRPRLDRWYCCPAMRKVFSWVAFCALSVALLAVNSPTLLADSGAAFGATSEGAAAVVAAGNGFNCWVSAGAVKCIGDNAVGQLGDGSNTPSTSAVQVVGLSSGVVAITAGDSHACALTQAGAIKCWGLNNRGQLGNGTRTDSTSPVQVTGLTTGVVRIDAGAETTCAVKSSGQAMCWGNNKTYSAGSLTADTNADGEADPLLVPTEVSGIASGAVAISVSGEGSGANQNAHGCAVLQYGDVVCWGSNSDGQLGVSASGPLAVATRVPLTSRVTAMSLGALHSCALTESGAVVCWGANSHGQLANGSTTAVTRGTHVSIAGVQSGVIQISSGRYTACALLQSGGLTCWGDNIHGTLSSTPTRTSITAPMVPHSLTSGIAGISLGEYELCALFASGALRCWGENGFGQTGDGYQERTISPTAVHTAVANSTPLVGIQTVTSSQWSTCGVTSVNGVKCWGANLDGSLGDGSEMTAPQPVPHASLTSGVARVEGGSHSMCAILSSAEVRCWGSNGNGQLGAGNTSTTFTTRSMLAALPSTAVTGVTDVSVGQTHSCVVSNGAAKCAGSNYNGSLGDGSQNASSVLVQVSGLTSGVSKVLAGGFNFSCAVLINGNVRCWGDGSSGQLGDGSGYSSSTPVAVSSLTNAVDVVAGEDFVCALISNGTVKCWGRNYLGQLGDGSTTDSMTPVVVSGVSGATAIAAGPRSVCVIVTGGGMKCWGWNYHGVFADGTTTNSSTPVTAVGISGMTSLSMGATSNCGVFASGAVKCWGSEQVGQLGNDRMWNRPYASHVVLASGIVSSTGLPQRSLLAATTTTSTTTTTPAATTPAATIPAAATTTTLMPQTTTTMPIAALQNGLPSRIDTRVYASAPPQVGVLSMVNVVRSSSLRSVSVRSITRSTCIAAGQAVVAVKSGDCVVLVRSLSSSEVLKRWKTTIVSTDMGVGSIVRIAPAVQFVKASQFPNKMSLERTLKSVSGARSALVVGHAAILTGNTLENRILSVKRAKNVAAVLREDAGVVAVNSLGIGGDVPVSRLLNESRQEQNRRVVVYYVP
jgi:alpha-tubulin suppressor-like RCC1 family protein